MAFEFGTFNEFSDPVATNNPVIFAAAKVIDLGPWDGQFYQACAAPQVTIDAKEFEIYNRSQTSRDGLIGVAVSGGTAWDNDDTTDLKMSADAVKGLTVGHVLQVGDEVVIVKAVDRSDNTIDVFARGAAGTTAAAHADNTPYKVIGFAGEDEDLKNVESVNETTAKYVNYVQTVFETIDWTKHAELISKGLSEKEAEIMLVKEAEIRVARMLATMAINGRKYKQVSSTTRWMSAGLIQQLQDNNSGTRSTLTYNASGDLTEAKLLAALKQIFDAGGRPDTIWVSPTVKGYINTFNMANSSLAINTTKEDHTAGGQYVSAVDYEGMILRVRVDSNIPSSMAAIVTMANCKKGWLMDDGLRLVDEPQKSSREMRKSLQGSLGFAIEGVGQDHILITGITGGNAERIYKTASAN